MTEFCVVEILRFVYLDLVCGQCVAWCLWALCCTPKLSVLNEVHFNLYLGVDIKHLKVLISEPV